MNRQRGMPARWVVALMICLTATATSSMAMAQRADDAAARRLALREAVELALRNNRNVRLAETTVARAAAEHEQARAIFRPQVLLGSGLAYTQGFPLSIEGSAPSIFQIGDSQALFDPNLRNRERQAKKMRAAAAQSLEDERDRIVAETVLAYLDLDRNRRSLEYLQGQSRSLEATAELMEQRVEAGLEPALETTRAQLGAARGLNALTALENEIGMLEFRLRDLTGITQEQRIETQMSEIPMLTEGQSVGEMATQALNNNPGLLALAEQVRAKQFQVRSEQGSRWPRVNLVGQYGLFSDHNNFSDFFQRFSRNNVTVGVSIVVPIYERERYNARLSKAEAELEEARLREQEGRAAVAGQVRAMWGAVRQQDSGREVARLELELAREALNGVLEQYEAGRLNRLQLERARVEENRAWISLFEADYQLERARLELLRITGQLRAALL